MISTAARVSLTRVTASASPRGLSVLSGRTLTTIGDQYKHKEKVEEDRYIRQMEQEMLERHREEAKGDRELEKALNEAGALLEQTGDKVSHEAMVSLAKWKLNRG